MIQTEVTLQLEEDRVMNVIIEIPAQDIVPDPEVPLFRGPIHSTATLQESIRQDGIQQPLWVRPNPEEEGTYFLFDGNRRFHAARQLELETVPCLVKDVDGDRASELALIASQSEQFPDIVLDEEGNVIGGNCLAVRMKVDKKIKRYVIAAWLNITSDVAGALYRLYDESVELKRQVEKGNIQITVYSLFKTAPQEVKDYIVSQKMPMSAGRVRKILRNWEGLKRELDELLDGDVLIDEPLESMPLSTQEVKVTIEPAEEMTTSLCLTKAMTWLKRVNGHQLEPTDYWLLEEIGAVIESLWEKRV